MQERDNCLPVGWASTSLEMIAEIQDSQRIPVNNSEREKRLANAKNLYPYYGATGQVGNIDDYIFEGEAVLLGEDAAPFLEFGKDKAYIANGRFWVNNHAHILRGFKGIDNRFLCNQLNIVDYRPFVSGTTRLKLTQGSMKNIPLWIAPLNEQKRIVDKIEQLFSNLDEGEALLKQVQKQLATYRQSVLKSAVTGELTKEWRKANKHRLESGDALLKRILKARRDNWKGRGKYAEPESPRSYIHPDLPDLWVVATIDQLSSSVDYGSSAKCSEKNLGVAVLRMGNIQNGVLDLTKLKFLPNNHDEFPKLLLDKGDLLFNRTNSAELVGKTATYKGKPDKCSYASYLIRVKLVETEPDFAAAYINSVFGKAWVKSVVSQQVGQANVNGTKLKDLCLPLPPKEEQQEIIQQLDDIFSQIDALENWCATELARSATLRQSILKDAFSGKLFPQDPSDEPASELLKRIQAERAKTTQQKSSALPRPRGRRKKSDKESPEK